MELTMPSPCPAAALLGSCSHSHCPCGIAHPVPISRTSVIIRSEDRALPPWHPEPHLCQGCPICAESVAGD